MPRGVCLSAAEISKHPQEWYSAASSHRSQPHDQSADGRLVGTAIPTIGHTAQRGTTEHGCGMASKSAGHADRGTQSTPPSREPGIEPGKMMCAQFQLQRNASIPIIRPVQSVPDDVDSSKHPASLDVCSEQRIVGITQGKRRQAAKFSGAVAVPPSCRPASEPSAASEIHVSKAARCQSLVPDSDELDRSPTQAALQRDPSSRRR